MGFSAEEIRNWVGAKYANQESCGIDLNSVSVEKASPLGSSRAGDISFFFSREYEGEIPSAAPSVLLIGELFTAPLAASKLPLWKKSVVLSTADPYFGMAVILEKLASVQSSVAHAFRLGQSRVHSSAVIDPTAELGIGVQIGAHSVIEAGAHVGAGTVIYPGCFVGPGVKIGTDCVLFPRVTLYEWTRLGDRVRLHAGTVIGSDGFGYVPVHSKNGKLPERHQKIYHLGRVLVGNDVEMGANCTIDRGTISDTVIEKSVKLDNQVHVGHNSRIGEGTVLCGGTCVAGGVKIGRFVYIGGLTGVARSEIGDGAKVAALSLITKDIPAGGTAVGNPQRDHREHFRLHAFLNRLSSNKHKREIKGGS